MQSTIFTAYKDIARLDIAMHQLLLMSMLKRFEYLANHSTIKLNLTSARQRSHKIRQIYDIDVFHHEVNLTGKFTGLDKAYNPWMFQLRQDFHLATK